MKHTAQLSKVMNISWQIQQKKKCTRSKALMAAWAITQNEDITVRHLVKKHSHTNNVNKVDIESLTLFKQ